MLSPIRKSAKQRRDAADPPAKTEADYTDLTLPDRSDSPAIALQRSLSGHFSSERIEIASWPPVVCTITALLGALLSWSVLALFWALI